MFLLFIAGSPDPLSWHLCSEFSLSTTVFCVWPQTIVNIYLYFKQQKGESEYSKPAGGICLFYNNFWVVSSELLYLATAEKI